jgi:hypothetical protein
MPGLVLAWSDFFFPLPVGRLPGCPGRCEPNYPRLGDAAFMGQFDVTMTYRRDSDLPLLYVEPAGLP